MPLIAPSLLASDFLHLGDVCQMVNNSPADWFHLDVMDGVFVPNISFGLPVIKQIRTAATKVCDVHLMIVEPDKYIEAFKEAGADILSVHVEACTHLHRTIQHIKSLGMKAGVGLNPHTPVSLLYDVLADIDVVCMMSVNPGFGGQKFIPHTLKKIETLRNEIDTQGFGTLIEIDGGVTEQNAADIVKAGAHVLVAGNTVFAAPDPTAVISALKNIQV